jgi:hypothetical protein
MTSMSPAWIPAGTAFDADDFVYFHDKGRRSLDAVLGEIDLILTGPHASAAFPEEMAPFVDDRLTRRLQHDFTDISTSPVGRRWAAIDPHVLYVENPHPRAVRDANRARPDDLEPGLRAAFARLREAGAGERPPLTGIDAVRPVTFGYLPVLREPQSAGGWDELIDGLTKAGALGVDVYERVRDDLIERTMKAKLARLRSLSPGDVTVSEWRSATTLLVMSLHDTMNLTARPDGAVCVERDAADRLPNVVALSNHGGSEAAVRASTTGALLDDEDVLSLDQPTMRAIANAYRWAFDAHGPDDVAFNRPYLGGFETRHISPWLRSRAANAVVDCEGVPVALHLGVWQNEFLREFLLGPEATAHLNAPGDDWLMPPDDHVNWLAERMRDAHDRVRRWGEAIA